MPELQARSGLALPPPQCWLKSCCMNHAHGVKPYRSGVHQELYTPTTAVCQASHRQPSSASIHHGRSRLDESELRKATSTSALNSPNAIRRLLVNAYWSTRTVASELESSYAGAWLMRIRRKPRSLYETRSWHRTVSCK